MTNHVNLANARFDDQRELMEALQRKGVCPFCPGQFPETNREILWESEFWFLTHNLWPRENTKLHLLAVYKPHSTKLSDLLANPRAAFEMVLLLAWAEDRFGIKGGLFFLRFGDMDYSGATVGHLHLQIVVPDKEKPDFEPVRFKVG